MVKGEGRNDPQQDTSQQDQQRQEQQKEEKQKEEQPQRDRQQQDQQQPEQQQRDRQQQNYQQQGNRHDWSHPAYHSENWQRRDNLSREAIRFRWHNDATPFRWHERVNRYSLDYDLQPIYDREWEDRFPGLHCYRWIDRRGEGFWYQGQRIVDAIMFFDDSDELVSIGFMYDGIFIVLRDDDQVYENHDFFFLLWWNQNG